MLAFSVTATLLAGEVGAQEKAGPALEEVIVTAQKTAEPLSRVPLAISALSAEALMERNYTTMEDFKGAIPGIQVNNYIGEARINIRGIGVNSLSLGIDPQVASSLNGVYTSMLAAHQAFLDLDRIEAVRGPQGTLYGRNATGGAINIISKRPTEDFEGSVQLGVGNYNEVAPQLILSGRLVGDRVLGRIAASALERDGYSFNRFDGKHYDDAKAMSVRGSLLFNVTDDVELLVIGDYHDEDDGNYAAHLLGTSPGFPVITGVAAGGTSVPLDANGRALDPRQLSINTLPENKRHAAGVSAELTWKLNGELTFKSITGYRNEGNTFNFDFDSTTHTFPSSVPGKDFSVYQGRHQFSEELQLLADFGWMTWVNGLYYYTDKVNPGYFWLGVAPSPDSFPLRLGGVSQTDAYAAFSQATFNATENLRITAGVRYSYEERQTDLVQELPALGVTINDSQKTDFDDVSPRFTIDYRWSEGLMGYITAAKGFKSGGFDLSASPPLLAFEPETLWDYEAGIKWRNRWASADVSVFHYDYRNLQVAQVVNGLPTTTNAATSTVEGVELATTLRPVRDLTISGAFAYLDARFDEFTEVDTLTGLLTDLSGNRLPGSAELSSNIHAQWIMPFTTGEVSLSGEWNWRDRVYFTEFNSKQVSQPAVSTYNAAVRYTHGDDRWYVELYGKNLSDELIIAQAWITGANFGSMVIGQLGAPRTYGVTLRYSF